MKALDIYEQDITDREHGTAMPRQQYYTALRDALHRELMQQGYSDLLEKLLLELRGGMERIYVVDYAVLTECHSMIVLDKAMRDAAEHVPHLHLRGGKARWADVEGQGDFSMPVSRDLPDKLRQLRSVSRQLVDARDDSVIPQADDAAQREIEQVHLLNKMLDDRCRSLQEERDALQARVKQLEEGVISGRVRSAIEARRFQEEENLRRMYEAQEAAAREAFRSRFAQDMADEQQRQEDFARQTAALREEAAADYAGIRQAMTDGMTELTVWLGQRIEELKGEMHGSECRMLAQSYVALHELHRVDMARLAEDAYCDDESDTLQSGSAEVYRKLGERLNQLEQAMLRLGLIVLRPAEGDAYDHRQHSSNDTGGDQVWQCIHPGVMVQSTQDVLVKAEVKRMWSQDPFPS